MIALRDPNDACILSATRQILRWRSAAPVDSRAQIMSSPLASDAKAQTLYRLSLGAREGISRCKGVCGVPGGKRSRAAVNFQPTQPEVAGRLPMAAMRCSPHASGVSIIHQVRHQVWEIAGRDSRFLIFEFVRK